MAGITFTVSILLFFFNQVTCKPTTQSSDKIPRTGIVTSMFDTKVGKEMYNAMQYHGEVKLDGKTYVRTVAPTGRTERDLELGDGSYLALINLLCVENNLNDCFDFLVVTSMGFASFGKFVAAAKLVRLADDDDLYQGVFVVNDMIEFVMKNAQCAVVDGKKMALVKTYACSKSSFHPYTKVAPPLTPPPSPTQFNDQGSDQMESSPPTKYPLGYTGAHPDKDNYPLKNDMRAASPSSPTQYNNPNTNQVGSSPPTKYPLGYTGARPDADNYPLKDGMKAVLPLSPTQYKNPNSNQVESSPPTKFPLGYTGAQLPVGNYPLSGGVRSDKSPDTNRPEYGSKLSAPPPPSTYALGKPATKPSGVRPSISPSGFAKPLGYTGAKPATSPYPIHNSDFTYPKDGENPEDVYIS